MSRTETIIITITTINPVLPFGLDCNLLVATPNKSTRLAPPFLKKATI